MITQTFTFACTECGFTHVNTFEIMVDWPPVRLALPKEWKSVDGLLLCPNHKVTVGDIPVVQK